MWTGSRDRKGYGKLKRERHICAAHRLSWEFNFGPIPDGMLILHRCDNPPCVRPDHLLLGTAADNTADMISKGRQKFGGLRMRWIAPGAEIP